MATSTVSFAVDTAVPAYKNALDDYLRTVGTDDTQVIVRTGFGAERLLSVTSENQASYDASVQLSNAIAQQTLAWTLQTNRVHLVSDLISAHVSRTTGKLPSKIDITSTPDGWRFTPLDERGRYYSVAKPAYELITRSLDVAKLERSTVFPLPLTSLALARTAPALLETASYWLGDALAIENCPPDLYQSLTAQVHSLQAEQWQLDHRHLGGVAIGCRECLYLRQLGALWPLKTERAADFVYKKLLHCGDQTWHLLRSLRSCAITGAPAEVLLEDTFGARDNLSLVVAGLDALMAVASSHPAFQFHFDSQKRFRSVKLRIKELEVHLFSRRQLDTFRAALQSSQYMQMALKAVRYANFTDAILARFRLLEKGEGQASLILSAADWPELNWSDGYYLVLREADAIPEASNSTIAFAIQKSLYALSSCGKGVLNSIRSLGPSLEAFEQLIALRPGLRGSRAVCLAEHFLALDRKEEIHQLGWSGLFSYGGLPGLGDWSEQTLRSPPRLLDIDHVGTRVIFRVGPDVKLDLDVSSLDGNAQRELMERVTLMWELGLWLDPWSLAYAEEIGGLPTFANLRAAMSRLGFHSLRLGPSETQELHTTLQDYLA